MASTIYTADAVKEMIASKPLVQIKLRKKADCAACGNFINYAFPSYRLQGTQVNVCRHCVRSAREGQ